MSDSCSGCSSAENCSSCGTGGCSEGGCGEQTSPYTPLNKMSEVKNVIAVVSGKGGVGKSLVTSLMSVIMQRRGNHTAVLDADITGPSIPKTFKLTQKASANEEVIFPVTTKTGIQVMSINLLLDDVTDPVLWRGPVIASTVTQFWSDVLWTGVDYMFVDMPPGTGDVPLTVFQSLPLDGIIVVTSPQELVSMIVGKAVKMANMMNVPIIGLVENMSYAVCPDCGKHINVFGESHIEQTAKDFGLKVLAKLPIDPGVAKLVDSGMIELMETDAADSIADAVEAFCK